MKAIRTRQDSSFYVTGGTLSRDAVSYVIRQADADLLSALDRGEFCYVLTARQMGKSSLMVRSASRLRDEGVGVVVLDLTAIGQNLTAEQWYGGLLTQMANQLSLDDELEGFWDTHPGLGPLHRWMHAVAQVVLPRTPGRVVVFIDEIDAVRSLPFSTDEFFAAIREFYNRRSENPELERLSFCLLGVAAPSDLIRDTRMTPFNIGRRLELHDFTETEAQVLAYGLARGDRRGSVLLSRILYWTNGHPYLTQRLCQAVAEQDVGSIGEVDNLCDEIFFARRAREHDDNLLFVRERLLHGEVELAGLLSLYDQVCRGKPVEDGPDSFITALKLSGITRIEDGNLRVRNRVYERVFDRDWIAQNIPDAETRRQRTAYRKGLLRAAGIFAVILVAMSMLVFMAIHQRNVARSAEETNRRQLYAAHMNLAARDWHDSSIEHMRDMLAHEFPQPGQTDLRAFDWYLLWALAHPDRRTLPLSVFFHYIAFSPDLKMFAAGGDADLKIFETAAGRRLNILDDQVLGQAVFSRDGKLLAADSTDHSIRLWDLSANHELRRLEGHTARLHTMAFSPDGEMLASGGEDQTARLWEVRTGKLLRTLRGHQHYIKSIAFSPDGKKAITGSIDETVRIWEVGTGKQLMTLKEHPAKKGEPIPPVIKQVAFSPDGRRVIAVGDFKNVAVWDAETGEALPALEGHRSWINALALSPDGNFMATGSADRTIRLSDVRTSGLLRSLTGHGNQVFKLEFSDDGQTLASASYDNTIKLWDVRAGPNPLELSSAQRVAFAPDGTKLATANDKELNLWDTTTWQVIASFTGHTARVRYIAYSPDGKFLASGSEDNTARLWDVSTGKERFVLKGHAFPIFGVAFSPDGKLLATASLDKTVRLWDVTTGAQLDILEGHTEDVQRVAFSPDGRLLASTSVDMSVRLWEVATRRGVAVLKGHAAHASDVVFSQDGKWLATTSLDSTIKLWNVDSLQERFTLKGHAGNVYAPVFSPDGRRLATAGQDSTIRFWDVETGQELAAFRNLNVWSMAFAPDGKTFVTAGGDGILRVWRAATEEDMHIRSLDVLPKETR